MTEVEAQLLFDEGVTSGKRTVVEQMMNLVLKVACIRKDLTNLTLPYGRLNAIAILPNASFTIFRGQPMFMRTNPSPP